MQTRNRLEIHKIVDLNFKHIQGDKVASQAQRKRKEKMRRHNSQTKPVKLDNSSAEVIQMDNYKGVKGMKKKIAKIIGRIKTIAKNVVNWFKDEDVQTTLLIGATGVSVAFASYQLGRLVALKKFIKVMKPINQRTLEFAKIVDVYVRLMDDFWNAKPELFETFVAFRDNWKANNQIVIA